MRVSAKTKAVVTDIELLEHIEGYDYMTKMAIMLSIVSELSPMEVAYLRWTEVTDMPLNAESVKILNTVPRYLFSDLVFWRKIEDTVSPITELDDIVSKVIGKHTMDEYRALYRNMVYIGESSRAFIRELNEQIFWRT